MSIPTPSVMLQYLSTRIPEQQLRDRMHAYRQDAQGNIVMRAGDAMYKVYNEEKEKEMGKKKAVAITVKYKETGETGVVVDNSLVSGSDKWEDVPSGSYVEIDTGTEQFSVQKKELDLISIK